jgi:hypothetical protein
MYTPTTVSFVRCECVIWVHRRRRVASTRLVYKKSNMESPTSTVTPMIMRQVNDDDPFASLSAGIDAQAPKLAHPLEYGLDLDAAAPTTTTTPPQDGAPNQNAATAAQGNDAAVNDKK